MPEWIRRSLPHSVGSSRCSRTQALRSFGTFAVSKRAAREGRNPRTGETVKIAARKAVTFKAGTALKDAVN